MKKTISYIKNHNKTVIFIFRIIFTVLIVWVIFLKVDIGKISHSFAGADFLYLVPIILLRPLFIVVRGLKIWQILRLRQKKIPVRPIIGWFFVSCSIGVFTPAGLGDFSLAYFGKKYDIDTIHCITSVLLDKLVTLFITISMAVIGMGLYYTADKKIIYWYIAIITFCPFIMMVGYKKRTSLAYFLEPRGSLFNALGTIKLFVVKHPTTFLLNLTLSLIQTFIVTAQLWLSFHFFRVATSFSDILWLSSISRLANQLPVTIGGLGVYEGAVMIVFQKLNISSENSLSAALVGRLITWFTSLVIVSWLLWLQPKKVK